MKLYAKINNNTDFGGLFSEDRLKEDWITTEVLPDPNLVVKKWNGSTWFEGATPEQIEVQNQKISLAKVKEFLDKKRAVGEAIFNDFELRITAGLIGKPLAEVQSIVNEIDSVLYKPLNLVKTGDFASAMFLFQSMTAPSDEFVLSFWNELATQTSDFYTNNYPTEELARR